MKNQKTILSAIAAMAVLVVTAFSSCQVVDLVKSGTTYYDTEIKTKDGQFVTGQIGGQRSSNLPSGSRTISIKTEEGRKKIKSEQIEYMKLSRKGHPEKQQTLMYLEGKMPYTKKGEEKFSTFKCWHAVYNAGDNLIITAYGNTFSLAKDGALIFTYDRDMGIQYCIMRRGDDCPIHIGRNISSRSHMRKQWLKYLADDPELCRKIADKTIGAFNFDEIVEQYNPKRK